MVIICVYCNEEITPLQDATCPECGSYLKKTRRPMEEGFEDLADWGEDFEEVEGFKRF